MIGRGLKKRLPAALSAVAVAAAFNMMAAAAAEFALSGPEIFKLDWDTRSLIATDLDGDGRTDLVLLNNDRARIDILYQKRPGQAEKKKKRRSGAKRWEPVLEDARFRREGIVTGIKMYALAAGDLDGDGLTDLAFTGTPNGLSVLYQGPDEKWERKRTFESVTPTQWASTLVIVDLDGDDTLEVAVLGEDDLLVFARNDAGELTGPRRYPLSETDCYGLVASDLDGDGRLDLMYLASASKQSWHLRLQRADGEFGPERTLPVPTPRRGLVPFRTDEDSQPAYAMVQGRTGLIDLLAVEPAGGDGDADDMLAPSVYGTPARDSAAESFALGDFDADGRIDLALADWKGAQVWLYRQRPDGAFGEPVAYPSFSDLRSLAAGDVDDDGAPELFVVSRKEEAIGMSRLSSAGRFEYPRPVPIEGQPLAIDLIRAGGSGAMRLAALVNRDGVRGVAFLELDAASGAWTERSFAVLDNLKTDPVAVEPIDADYDGRMDLAVFVLRSPMRLLLQQEDGTFVDASTLAGFRSGLLDNLLPAHLGSGDLDGDGREDMLVVGKGFARVLELGPDGGLSVRDQFNTRNQETEVAAVLAADLDRDDIAEILLLVDDGDAFEILKRGDDGVYRFHRSEETGSIDLVDARAADIDGDGRNELLYLGKGKFWVVALNGNRPGVRSIATHESEWEEMEYQHLAAADLDGDGRMELLALDSGSTHALEILSWTGEDGWTGEFHFTVFDPDPHYRGRTGSAREPREILTADVTSDGRPDVIFLVHDRVLVYPGAE
jgi:hypothetical protein